MLIAAQTARPQEHPQKAAAHCVRFAELWKDCDPEYQPLLEEAKRRMTKGDG